MAIANARIFELALKGLEAERARIDSEIAELRSQMGLRRQTSTGQLERAVPSSGKRRRSMSAEARRKISEAMKRSHAARRKGTSKADEGKQHERGLTAAGRKKLSEMMKARWAAKKKAGKKGA